MEEWRPVVGHEDRYEVSDQGRVRSLVHQSRWGPRRRKEPRLLKPDTMKGGYLRVTLARDGKNTRRPVHLLVLETFVGPCPDGHEGSHVNGNPADNTRSNLAWETSSENNLRKRQHGTAQRGERGGRAKLTRRQVLAIREEYQFSVRGRGAQALGQKYGVNKSTILNIIHRRTWTHI